VNRNILLAVAVSSLAFTTLAFALWRGDEAVKLAAVAPCAGPSGLPPARIVIDAGHGGRDPGATGSRGLREKNVNLDVARSLAASLQQQGVSVVLTRRKDVTVSLSNRIATANRENPDLFISIHANFNRDRRLHGAMTLYRGRTSADPNRVRSARAARLIEAALTPVAGFVGHDRGVVADRRGIRILREIRVPAVLSEVGFLSDAASESKLASTDYRRAIAAAISGGAMQYLHGSPGKRENP